MMNLSDSFNNFDGRNPSVPLNYTTYYVCRRCFFTLILIMLVGVQLQNFVNFPLNLLRVLIQEKDGFNSYTYLFIQLSQKISLEVNFCVLPRVFWDEVDEGNAENKRVISNNAVFH